jgi:hypothetical protein
VLWKLRTGHPGAICPSATGRGRRVQTGLYRWRRDGTWDRILAQVQTCSDAVGIIAFMSAFIAKINGAHPLCWLKDQTLVRFQR